MTGQHWTCRGTVRGWCRTVHQTERDAEGHIAEDDRAARMAGQTTDRNAEPYAPQVGP